MTLSKADLIAKTKLYYDLFYASEDLKTYLRHIVPGEYQKDIHRALEYESLENALKVVDQICEKANIEEGEPVATPFVEINPETASFIETGVVYPNEERLTAYVAESDYGTFQTGALFQNKDGKQLDLCLAEIKKGDLAENYRYSKDNKNIDIYLWSNPFSEEYTTNTTVYYDDIEKTFKDDITPEIE